MRSHPRTRPLLRAVLGGLSLSVAASGVQARLTPSDGAGPLPREARNPPRGLVPSWWTGFGEPALVAMQQAAAARAVATGGQGLVVPAGVRLPVASVPLDLQVAAAFIATRVLNVRLALADELDRALVELRRVTLAGPPTTAHAASLADIDLRMAATERHARALRARRDDIVAMLAGWCGIPSDDFPEDFRASLAAPKLPAFGAEAPARLARAVLVKRSDVSGALRQLAAERKRAPVDGRSFAEAVHRLAGWIEPTPGPSVGGRPDIAATAEPQDELERVVERAEREVRDHLGQLWAHSRQTARHTEVLRSRQLDLSAAEHRLAMGAGSPSEVIAARQLMLFEGDQLALASGDLALAWMRLESSTGGHAIRAAQVGE